MKKFFQSILSILKFFFNGKLDVYLKEHVQQSVEFLINAKKWIDSPVMDLFVILFPGDGDDKLRELWSNKLAIALKILVPDIMVSNQDLQSQIEAFQTYLTTLSPAMQRGAWLNLSVELSRIDANVEGVKDSALILANQNVFVKKKFDINVDQLPALTNSDLQEHEPA